MNTAIFKSSLILFPVLTACSLLAGGCSKNVHGTWKAPLVYRIDVQQGNVIEQDMINKLKPGMDKNQVKYIMGTPLVTDPFHSNRWDYVYSMEPGRGERQQRRITLYFRDDKLAYIDGDIQIRTTPITEDETREERNVVVPIEQHQEGFFSNWFDGDDDKPDSEIDAETALAEEPASEEVTPETDESLTETDDADAAELPPPDDDIYSTETATTDNTANQAQSSVNETEQDKNLFRRFWERMTSDKSESGIQEGEESERDLRDAEVFEDAGGEL